MRTTYRTQIRHGAEGNKKSREEFRQIRHRKKKDSKTKTVGGARVGKEGKKRLWSSSGSVFEARAHTAPPLFRSASTEISKGPAPDARHRVRKKQKNPQQSRKDEDTGEEHQLPNCATRRSQPKPRFTETFSREKSQVQKFGPERHIDRRSQQVRGCDRWKLGRRATNNFFPTIYFKKRFYFY